MNIPRITSSGTEESNNLKGLSNNMLKIIKEIKPYERTVGRALDLKRNQENF